MKPTTKAAVDKALDSLPLPERRLTFPRQLFYSEVEKAIAEGMSEEEIVNNLRNKNGRAPKPGQ